MKEIIIAISVILVALIIGIVIIVVCRKKLGSVSNDTQKSKIPEKFNLKLNKSYMNIKELKFLEILNRVLPTECIAFPKVGVDTIISPDGDKVAYNLIVGQNVDICVFLIKTMEPILVVELYENDTIKQGLKVQNVNVIKALNTVKLPILKYVMKDEIDKDELKEKVLKSIKAEALVQIITKK